MDYKDLETLSSLIGRNLKSTGTKKNRNAKGGSHLLMLKQTDDGICLLPVHENMKAVDVCSIDPDSSPCGLLIRRMQMIFEQMKEEFSWSGEVVDTKDGLSLSRHVGLVDLIMDCAGYLVNENGGRIELLMDDTHPVVYKVAPSGDGNSAEYHGEFRLRGGDKVVGFLSATLALTDGVITRVADVGAGYAGACRVFDSSFRSHELMPTLSMMLSAVSNVLPEVDGWKVRVGKAEMREIPSIVFEKVDIDDSLFMSVGRSVADLPLSLCAKFRFSRIATVEDGMIVIREVRELDEDPVLTVGGVLRKAANKSKKRVSEIWMEDNVFIIPRDVASVFLFSYLPGLLDSFQLMGAEKLKDYRISAPKARVNIKISSGINYLEADASVDVDGESFSISDILMQYGRDKYVTLSDGTRAILDPKYMSRLQRIFGRGSGAARNSGDKVRLSFFDLPEVMELLDDSQLEDRPFQAYREFFEGFNGLSGRQLSMEGLNVNLRDYQKEGVKWLLYLHDNRMGGCLADDMGLGKTVQTIVLLHETLAESGNPSLIVVPRSLVFNWEAEFGKFAPEMDVYTYYGMSRNLEEALRHKVILTSYAVLRNDIEQFKDVQFHYVILDESQSIKNIGAQITRSVWLLKAEYRLAISGTPVENNLTEIYSLFRFLNSDMFGSLDDFSARYALPIQEAHDEDAAAALRKKIYPFILRRLKSDVLTDLPDITEQVITVEMTPEQARFYEQRRRYFAQEVNARADENGGPRSRRFEMLQALSELRQIASVPEEKSDGRIASPKIELLCDNVVQAVESGHKVVVFFNFLAGIELAADRLEKSGIGTAVMTGATSDRKKVVERFQNDPDCHVMLMTVKTGGVGLNLTAADMVFVAEPWWNRAAEKQAISRLHRMGQKKAVNCYYLITSGTIEEKIRLLQDQKAAIFDAVISSDSLDGKQLSDEEIAFLLNPD